MVVAGRLPPAAAEEVGKTKASELISYEILATQADGMNYAVHGSYNGSEVTTKHQNAFTHTYFSTCLFTGTILPSDHHRDYI